jgi:hypothetical protein
MLIERNNRGKLDQILNLLEHRVTDKQKTVNLNLCNIANSQLKQISKVKN